MGIGAWSAAAALARSVLMPVLIIGVLGLNAAPAPAAPLAPATVPARRTVVVSPDGVKLIAYEWGNPAGPPILFIHGSFQSSLSWMDQTADPRLTSKYRLVAFDLRGHGGSDKPDDVAAYRDGARWAGDVAAVIDTLHLQKPVVVAWSYGARVLADYLQAHGDGRLGGIVLVGARSTNGGAARDLAADPDTGRIARQALSGDPMIFFEATRAFVLLCTQKPIPTAQVDILTLASVQTPAYVRQAMSGRPLVDAAVFRRSMSRS
jgi:pimeloyl-ACP methyl ester carboxylesterase